MRHVMSGAALAATLVCLSPVQAANAPSKQDLIQQQMAQLKASAKSGTDTKLSSSLLGLKNASPNTGLARAAVASRTPGLLRVQDGYVRVSAYGADPVGLKTQLVAKGMLDAKVYERSVSGRVPVSSLADLSSVKGLALMKGAMAVTHAGKVTSQGDHALRSDVARQQFDVTGKGVRVGVLSDSFDCAPGPFAEGQRFSRAADDVLTDDLPKDIHVLADYAESANPDCADEGRAMMQIVHDVAPGAAQSFYTAFISEADFANGILALAKDGAKVIVDDVIYFDEPMFENGIVADAVNTVKKQGVAYFSSAGNEARQSYSSKFRLTQDYGLDGPRHNFDPGRGVDTLQQITVPSGGDSGIFLNWDEPSFSANGKRASSSDLDVIFYNKDGTPVPDCNFLPDDATYCQFAGIAANVGGDAVEIAEIVNFGENPVDVEISIELYDGPAPNLIKYVWYDLSNPIVIDEWDTQSGTLWGHANAEGAEAVGAAWWFDTAPWGAANHPACKAACVNYYSSAGGTPIIFDDQGERKKTPYVGFKPGVTGPDGGNTTFFYYNFTSTAPGGEPDSYPNFFGTSAAAPHVAAVAALMLDQRAQDNAAHKHFLGPKELTPDIIYSALRSTAEDIKRRSFATSDPTATEPLAHPEGFDLDSGFGLVNAQKALKLLKGF